VLSPCEVVYSLRVTLCIFQVAQHGDSPYDKAGVSDVVWRPLITYVNIALSWSGCCPASLESDLSILMTTFLSLRVPRYHFSGHQVMLPVRTLDGEDVRDTMSLTKPPRASMLCLMGRFGLRRVGDKAPVNSLAIKVQFS